jgi:hypothetical protein
VFAVLFDLVDRSILVKAADLEHAGDMSFDPDFLRVKGHVLKFRDVCFVAGDAVLEDMKEKSGIGGGGQGWEDEDLGGLCVGGSCEKGDSFSIAAGI